VGLFLLALWSSRMRIRCLSLGLVLACLAPPLLGGEAKKADDKDRKKAAGPTYRVPYRVTDTLHVLVRAKVNGKGPFNFIIDTGAPALFVADAVGKKLGLAKDKKGWAVLDRFELEGGAAQEKVKARVETPFQLEGMNALGLAGAELHGVIGYTVLAQYRMEFDFTKDRMTWTRLDFEPPPLVPIGKGGGGAGGLELVGSLMKLAGFLLGGRPAPETAPRGFLGLDAADADGWVRVASVLDKGPAAAAGLKTGDYIVRFQRKTVKRTATLQRLAARVTAGEQVRLTVLRGDDIHEIAFRAGEGL
jgi:hypothetical protein